MKRGSYGVRLSFCGVRVQLATFGRILIFGCVYLFHFFLLYTTSLLYLSLSLLGFWTLSVSCWI